MTIDDFKAMFGIEKIKLFKVEDFIFSEPINVKLSINKDITENDLMVNRHLLEVIPYLDEYVVSKNGLINQYGISIKGSWCDGFALDFHTTKSSPEDVNAYGDVIKWKTIRPPIGEELYRLKYWKEKYRVKNISKHIADFLVKKNETWHLDVIVPIPPSDTNRSFQPVHELANEISAKTGISIDYNYLIKTKQTAELKSILNPIKRKEVLSNAFEILEDRYRGQNILLFDDLFRSGTTLNVVSELIGKSNKRAKVYVLTVTKTRTKK